MSATSCGTVRTTCSREFRLGGFQPLARARDRHLGATPIAAAVVGTAFLATLITTFQVAAQCGRAAHLDAVMPPCGRPTRCILIMLRSGEHVRYFPLRLIGHRRLEVLVGSGQPPPYGGGDRGGWLPNRPCRWRCEDTAYGGRAAAEWCGHLCRIRGDEPQKVLLNGDRLAVARSRQAF